jgi:hypothetical protein
MIDAKDIETLHELDLPSDTRLMSHERAAIRRVLDHVHAFEATADGNYPAPGDTLHYRDGGRWRVCVMAIELNAGGEITINSGSGDVGCFYTTPESAHAAAGGG